MRTDIAPSGDGRAARVAGYGPADIKSAYNLPDGGAGVTVAITEAHDAVTAESDLAVYRNQYGLPPCTTANGCFKKINQRNDSAPSGLITGVAGKCVDVPYGSDADNNQIELYDCNKGQGQWWRLPGDGTVRSLKKCLDTRGGGTTAGTPVVLFDCTGTASQQWQARADKSLYNPKSQQCLDATGGSSQNTTPLELWPCTGGANQQWILPPLPSIYPPPDPAGSTDSIEIALDLDAVSAACPACHLLLVEADDFRLPDLGEAINRAVTVGAKYVSNSWGFWSEALVNGDVGMAAYDNRYLNHPGVLITTITGDNGFSNNGFGPQYPGTSPYVLAVGGTTLKRDATAARGWTESAWSGAGSGCSALEQQPAWQKNTPTGCGGRRASADVSAVADPATGFAVYDSDPRFGGWGVLGGTSLAAPLVTAMYALAGLPGPNDNPASYPYAHPDRFNDVTAGNNGTCGAPLCTAAAGWDGPTGLGSPNGVAGLRARSGPITGIGGKCVDVTGGGNANNTQIELWTCHGGANQQWTFSGDGTVRSLGKCLDAQNGGTADLTNVVLFDCGGGPSQRWQPRADKTLYNPNSGRCLDATGNSSADGTALILYSCYGSANQQWTVPA